MSPASTIKNRSTHASHGFISNHRRNRQASRKPFSVKRQFAAGVEEDSIETRKLKIVVSGCRIDAVRKSLLIDRCCMSARRAGSENDCNKNHREKFVTEMLLTLAHRPILRS